MRISKPHFEQERSLSLDVTGGEQDARRRPRTPRRPRPRQADVARLAGVSQTTVSLVLNDSASVGQIPAETRQRVLDAADRLRYAADPAARSLAGGRNL